MRNINKKAKYLVTGGCGFIGSHLCDSLIQAGHQVRILDDLSSGSINNAPPKAELIVGSILDKNILKKSLEDVKGCFHLAAIVSVEKTIRMWAHSHAVNQLGTVNLFESLVELGLKIPVVYASSSAVYGHPKKLPIDETTPLFPLSPYAVDKVGCEQHASLAWNLFGIPSVGLRLFNVYGPRQDSSSPYSGVISLFVEKICKGVPITIFGSGEQKRDFIHVYDVVRFFMAAMDKQPLKGTFVYNVCTNTAISVRELAELIEKLSQKKAEKNYAPPRSGEVLISVGDRARSTNAFEIKAEINLETGLSTLIENLMGVTCVGVGSL